MGFAIKTPGHDRDQEGFTLVGVLIILGLIAICATLFMNVSNQSRVFKKKTAASMTTQDIEEMIKADMVDAAQKYFRGGCKGSPTFSRTLGAAGTEQIDRIITLPSYAPPIHTAAAKRCAASPYLRALGTGHALYLCVAIKKNGSGNGAMAASLLDADYTFAEFYFRPYLPQNNTPVSCNTIMTHQEPPNTTLDATYSIYWAVRNKNDPVTKQHTSYFVTRID